MIVVSKEETAPLRSGIIVIDKPADWTSHDVVARVRKVLRERRVGHTGTLDPFATGVLVVLVGQATRLSNFLVHVEKEYLATIRLGFRTDTGDWTGIPIDTVSAPQLCRLHELVKLAPEQLGVKLEEAFSSLRGQILQTPPMYSAKKIEGQRLYKLARQGIVARRSPVAVNVQQLDLIDENSPPFSPSLIENRDGTYDFKVHVTCSAGTYIRTLAESIGERLGVGAHLAALRRIRAGVFGIEGACRLDLLEDSYSLRNPDSALEHLNSLDLTCADERRVRNGLPVRINHATSWMDQEFIRLRVNQDSLLAIGIYIAEEALIRPRVVLASQ
ncbi:MAG: tRNA pseudouridine(55) synthase TruB [Pyrinomonadaceae bacterium]